jgi:glucokinase
VSLLALDVGGTKLAASFGDRSARAPTPASGEAALDALLELGESVVAGDVRGVGVSFGGHVDARRGVVARSLHVPGWEDVPLAAAVAKRFRAPAAVENDANAGALGEWDDAGRPSAPLCYVTVSTGVGAGLVVSGEVLRGRDGLAGEVGHLVVDPAGPLCACGRRGCVEAGASGPAIARRGGDDRAFADAARALAVAVAALIAVVNPAVVAIGGGVAEAGPPLWDPLLAELRAIAWPQVTTEVRPAADDAPLRGARVLAERAATRYG